MRLLSAHGDTPRRVRLTARNKYGGYVAWRQGLFCCVAGIYVAEVEDTAVPEDNSSNWRRFCDADFFRAFDNL